MGAATALVRPAHAEDDAPARALLERAGLPLDGYEQSWGRWVVTDRSGALVGVVALERHGTPSVYLLRSLAVAPKQRGTGVGVALVRVALAAADAHEQGRAGVGLLTETAAGYFRPVPGPPPPTAPTCRGAVGLARADRRVPAIRDRVTGAPYPPAREPGPRGRTAAAAGPRSK